MTAGRRNLVIGGVAVGLIISGWWLFARSDGEEDRQSAVLPPTSATSATSVSPSPPRTAPPQALRGDTLQTVEQRGILRCGVNEVLLPGFTESVGDQWTGFDVEFCQAIAAAVLGDTGRVEYVGLNAASRFAALQSGDIDVLIRNTTYTSQRDVRFDFGPITFHDGQQVLAREADGFSPRTGIVDLEGETVCVNEGSTSADNIKAAVAAIGVPNVTIREVADIQSAMDDFIGGVCDAVTSDGSALAAQKRTRERASDPWVVFPSRPISNEPLGPVYRSGDSQWADIVNWTVYATVVADRKELTASNVRLHRDEASRDPDALDLESQILLGLRGSFPADLGLSADAFFQVIDQVGNYDEIYRRNLGPLGFARPGTLNAPVSEGGLIWAPPLSENE